MTPAGTAGEALLAFDHVSKWYGAVAALSDVSFTVGEEIVGLVGKNGVGKSSLLKLAAGLLTPSQGRVLVAGLPAASRAAHAIVGFAPDVDRLHEDVTAVRFVADLLRYHGPSRTAARARAAAVLGELGLGDHMHRPIREYSKGMRQRVRLAQALAHEPRLVLLDEPMTGLDPVARSELAATIRALPARGVGVLVSSHVLHELEAVADRIVLVHQGRLLANGSVDQLREQVPARPHRLRIRGASPRELAARLVASTHVLGVEVVGDVVEAQIDGDPEFYGELTRLGGEWIGGITEIRPLDDDLAAVFGYLIG